MSRFLDRIMVCGYVALAATPVALKLAHVRDHAVSGVVPTTPHPSMSVSSMADESYQKAYTAWFENTLGTKGWSVFVDNSVLYHVFGDSRFGATVRIGLDGMLFSGEDLAYYNRDDRLYDPAHLDKLADQIAAAQRRLRSRGRALVPLIIPSKTTFYRDKVPDRIARATGQPRITDLRLYLAMKRALEARGVVYVDMRELLLASREPRDLLWGPTARHWSEYGACLAIQQTASRYVELTGIPFAYDCNVHLGRAPLSHDDYDLARLLNGWFLPHPKQVPLVSHGEAPANVAKPSVMFIGTSFCWTMLRDAGKSHRFAEPQHMDYYDKTLVSWPVEKQTEVKPHTPEWRDVFLTKDLYVLDLFEVYFSSDPTYLDTFLDAIVPELVDAPAEVTSGAAIDRVVDLGIADGSHYFEVWGTFPNPTAPYTATVTCDGVRHLATVYYQNPNGQQLNIQIRDPGPGTCDAKRASGLSCSFHVQQSSAFGTPAFGPQRVCPGKQGTSGQDADGRCTPGLGC